MLLKYNKNVKKDYIQHPELTERYRELDNKDYSLNMFSNKINRRIDLYLKSGPHNKKISYINDVFRDVEDFNDE